jgi:hypothetical protein
MQPSSKVSISYIDATHNSNLPDECDRGLSHCMAVSNVGLDHFRKGLLGTLKQNVASKQQKKMPKTDLQILQTSFTHSYTSLHCIIY